MSLEIDGEMFRFDNTYDPIRWGQVWLTDPASVPTVPFRCVVCGLEWEVSTEQRWGAMWEPETGGLVDTPEYKVLDRKPDGSMPLAFPDGFVASRCWDHPDDICASAFVLTEWKLKPLDEQTASGIDPDNEGG